MNCSDSQIPRNNSLFNPHDSSLDRRLLSSKYRVTQKLTNSSLVFQKTKDPFWPKICMNSKQLFTEVEVNSGGYSPSREAAR